MKSLHVAFLWHMHQPYYKDNLKNRYLMPWVRLHGIKGYFDMIDLLEDYPEMKATFNLVPSLIIQLLDYCKPETTDPFLEHTLIPANELTLDQKQFILMNFFMANWNNMIKPYPRYWELLVKRGFKIESQDLHETTNIFRDQDFRDLQAWANLAWFGYRAKKRYPEISQMMKKGKDYSQVDILRIIELQREIIKQIIPSYKKAYKEGRIELSTSAFYHPILPLVYDTNIAKRCMSWAPLPKRFHYPEDAESQIKKALDLFEKIFEEKPKGLWPSEGSVCPELIPILAKQGIQWIATDEEILTHSKPISDKGSALFKPYQVVHEDSSINIFFRDRGLSDLIGFTYSHNPPEISAQDLIQHLAQIQKYHEQNDALVSVILDGENAWEHYSDGGEGFLRAVYKTLSQSPILKPVTFSQYLKIHPQKETLPTLHSGSWIHHDFDIWIGSEEENTAWEYLGKTREFVKELKNIPQEKMGKILNQIYIAEGSDWFWWYGDDFSTENDEEFDQLFRLQLAACYELANVEVPEYLHQPVLDIKSTALAQKPIGFIEPVIDGKTTHFFEWHEAGSYQVSADVAMHRSEKYIKQIFFGFNLRDLYFRIDPYKIDHIQNLKKIQVSICLTGPSDYKMVVPYAFKVGKEKKLHLFSSTDSVNYQEIKKYSSAAFEDTLELTLPFKELKLKGGDEIRFRISISSEDIVLEMHPKFGYLTFIVPTKDFETEMWSV